MRTRFEALGAHLPEKIVSTADLIAGMNAPPPFDLEAITGIRTRRVRGEGEDSLALALTAARACLKRSRYAARELDVVISCSITRSRGPHVQCFEPSFAAVIAQELGAPQAIHFDVSNACAGMMTGVFALDRMIKAGIVKNGLVVSGECITPIAETAQKEISEPFDPQFGSLTVGDSGVAVVVDGLGTDADELHYVELTTCAEYALLCIGMPSELGNGAALYTNNAEMHKAERVQLWPRFHMEFLKQRGSSFQDEKYDVLVHHQVGTKAMRNFSRFGGEIFGTEMPPQLSVVETLGNTATTSHFVVLHEHLREKRVPKGAKVLLVPAASGVVAGCLAATISSLEVC
jgi:3-oxoacyl-[acyl-carrier-protein] synthase-3